MKSQGFTLIELIVVIIILAILGVSVYPKINSSGYSAITDQQQVISLLRTVQNRAMQNTQDSSCQGVNITSSNIGLAAQANDGSCLSAFETVSTTTDGYLNLKLENDFTVISDSAAILSAIYFDDWGRPELFDLSSNRIGATITIDSTEKVCIESQGYIYACP